MSVSTKAPARGQRADRFEDVLDRLTPIERASLRFVQASFERPALNNILRQGQRFVGANWVLLCTRNLLHVRGLERLPRPDQSSATIWASNHRSFFDMYVANAVLFKEGYRQRILFPVRSKFFYDTVSGFLVNGVMSFWSMYPPVFRDRKRVSLNHASFAELARAVQQGRSVGIHPEGTRNLSEDPYSFLPAQSGVGRLMHLARAPVVPIFINGLGNNLPRQVQSNFDRTGTPIIIVFGEPMELQDLHAELGTAKVYREVADRVMKAIARLGEEEKRYRAELLVPVIDT